MSETQTQYLYKSADGQFTVTEEGLEYWEKMVTNPTGQIYAFTKDAPALVVAAAMARLSRRGDPLRITWLDEFSTIDPSRAEGVLDRVITAYGDDSVQQLGTLSLVVEGASNLLTKP